MSEERSEAVGLEPHFEDVQAHYDLSDEFFKLFPKVFHAYFCRKRTLPIVTKVRGSLAAAKAQGSRIGVRTLSANGGEGA